MRKIITFILMLFLAFGLFSCTKQEEENYYKIIEMPRDIEYGILTNYSYVEYGKAYFFENLIKDTIKQQKNKAVRDAFIEETILIDNRLYIAAKYLVQFSLDTKYVICYFDIETKKIEIIDLIESVRGIYEFREINNYLVANYDDGCYLYDLNNDENVLNIDVNDGCFVRTFYSGIVHITENKLTIYDRMLNKYELEVEINLDTYSWSHKPYFPLNGDFIRYNDINNNDVFINYKTLEIKDYDEYYNEIIKNNNNNQNKDDIFECDVDDDYIKLIYDDITYEYNMDYFRNNHNVITDVEALCSTVVSFDSVFEYNDEIFISIGNDDSLFGLYVPGRTISLIFRFNIEEESFSYVGTSAQIYQGVIKMICLE